MNFMIDFVINSYNFFKSGIIKISFKNTVTIKKKNSFVLTFSDMLLYHVLPWSIYKFFFFLSFCTKIKVIIRLT